MSKTVWVIVIALVVVVGAGWAMRGKVVDLAADEVIKKFKTSTAIWTELVTTRPKEA